MATSETEVKGLAELDRLLKQLPAVVEGNVMRGALRAGQKVIQDEAKSLVSEDEGDLKSTIRIQFRRRSIKRGWVRMHLVAGGKKAPQAHWLEYGTASYYSGRGRTVGKPYKIKPRKGGALLFGGKVRDTVTHPGSRPKPFMRPAMDRGQARALKAIEAYLRKRIPKEILKAKK